MSSNDDRLISQIIDAKPLEGGETIDARQNWVEAQQVAETAMGLRPMTGRIKRKHRHIYEQFRR